MTIDETRSQISKNESGASLVELLVAVAIIASVLVIFVSGLSTSAFAVRSSDRHTTANNLAASQLETIKAANYVTGTAAYPAIPGNGYTISQTISYWDGTAFVAAPAADQGMQWITVTVALNSEMLTTVGNYKVNR